MNIKHRINISAAIVGLLLLTAMAFISGNSGALVHTIGFQMGVAFLLARVVQYAFRNANWMQRWENQDIGWHHVEFNTHLLNHWHALFLPQVSLVLAPLCGKSRDGQKHKDG